MEICRELGIEKVPAIVRNLTDEQAVSMMVDANLHRENILPSERAFAYKMKWEAIRKQGQRTDLTLSQPATKYRSDERIANEFGIGKDTSNRYIRLTYLISELFEMSKPHEKDIFVIWDGGVELLYETRQLQRTRRTTPVIKYFGEYPKLDDGVQIAKFFMFHHLARIWNWRT